MSVRNRLIAGFGAAALGPFITALVQVVSVPVFLHSWGPALYGQWLVLSAIPAYLSMTDMGFGSVGGNDMAMRVASSDKDGALGTFQSTWLLVTGISVLIGACAFGILFSVPITNWLQLNSLGLWGTRSVLFWLSVYSLGTLQTATLLAAFRSDGQYALGNLSINIMRLVENAVMLLLVILHSSPGRVALAAAVIRLVGTVVLFKLLVVKLPWIRVGMSRASWLRIKELTRPAFAFMAFPAGNALSLQGMTILTGILLGPVAVATFNPMRTLSRFAYQILDSIKNAVWPELSAAYGSHNWPLARRLHRSCCQVAFWLAILAVLGLGVLGPSLFRVWTHGRITMNLPCFYTLLLVVVASSFWNTSSAVSIAANLHGRLAVYYLAGTAVSLGLAYVLTPHLGMTGPALALLAADVWMGCFVIRASNHLLQDDTNDFIRSMFLLRPVKLLVAH
jgi:O-antigen/teichoic acid export membrane protein